MCRSHRRAWLPLIPDGARVLTHCNAGALATGGIGTALAPIYLAAASGKARRSVRRRDAAAAAGKPAHGVGADARRHSSHGARRQRGGVAHARGAHRSLHRRRRPHRGATATSRTRSAPIGSPSPRSITASRSTSPRRQHVRPGDAERRADRHRAARRRRGASCGFGVLTAAPRPRVLQSRVRRHAGRADHRDRQRSRRSPPAVRLRGRDLAVNDHVLAIDEGTTGVTCLVIARRTVVSPARGYREIPQYFPEPGWVEHDAAEILERDAARGARGARARRGATPRAIGITNQRETVVVWDARPGRRSARAIVWQDRRTAARCARARAASATGSPRAPGCVLDPYFSATKLEWLLATTSARAAARSGRARRRHDRHAGSSGSSPAARCTRPTRRTRRARCSTTSTRMQWSDELLRAVWRADARCCPRCVPSSGDFGVTHGATASASRCRSRASPATSRPRCSARGAGRRARRRTPTAPARSCC